VLEVVLLPELTDFHSCPFQRASAGGRALRFIGTTAQKQSSCAMCGLPHIFLIVKLLANILILNVC
jgi:hypothetical protein